MFLDIAAGVKKKQAVLREPPWFKPTGWTPPTFLPDIRDCAMMSLDVETKEPDFDHGPGWGRGVGHIVGFSIAAVDRQNNRFAAYCPVRHEVESHLNMDAKNAFGWAKAMLESPCPKTGANLMYDVGWFGEEGINVQGELNDVQFAEALINEHHLVSLDDLGKRYLGRGKETNHLYEWSAKAYGGNATGAQRANIWRSPPSLVGPYGEQDAIMPIDILFEQLKQLHYFGVYELFQLENRLIRLYIRMRRAGIQIDLNYAEQLYYELQRDSAQLKEEFKYKYGMECNPNAGASIARVFDHLGLKYPRKPGTQSNPAGTPSFEKEWLKALDHPIGGEINRIKELDKLSSTFVRSYMLEANVKGKIHCSFHPLKGDTSGAKTGRYSSSDPNLQNIPARTAEGKKIRKAFIHDHGHAAFEKNDYSQIEYRMLAHHAVDNGDGSADALRNSYINDPTTDYHDLVYYRVCPFMGWDANDEAAKKDRRRPIKNTNFGLLYGQGVPKLSRSMNFTPKQSKEFFGAYHTGAPYVKPTMQMCADEVHATGMCRTILGRMTHFDLWAPIQRNFDEDQEALPYDWALKMYGSAIQRAYDYRAVNYKFQGGAADVFKSSLDAADRSGVFDYIGVPRLLVHDETDFSVIDETPQRNEAHKFFRHLCETTLPLRVPVRVDSARGPNWAEAE